MVPYNVTLSSLFYVTVRIFFYSRLDIPLCS